MTNEQYIAQKIRDYATDAGSQATPGGFKRTLHEAAQECSVGITFRTPGGRIRSQELRWVSASDHEANLIRCFDVTVMARRDINPTTGAK